MAEKTDTQWVELEFGEKLMADNGLLLICWYGLSCCYGLKQGPRTCSQEPKNQDTKNWDPENQDRKNPDPKNQNSEKMAPKKHFFFFVIMCHSNLLSHNV